MVQFVRSAVLAAAVCSGCLVASAVSFDQASLNRATPVSWHVASVLIATALLVVAAIVAHVSGVFLLEVAAAVVAGGLLANSLVAGACGGVADFISAGGWLYSPGDLAVIGGSVLLAAGTGLATARTL
jgi:hypothetical protein